MIENDDNNKISSGDAEDDDCGGGGVTTKAFPSGCRACTCAGELLPRRGTTTVTQDQAAHASSPSPRLHPTSQPPGRGPRRIRRWPRERRYRVVVVLFVLPGSGI
ncbi:unnamed protein product [Prorocentrum cordatum]|uniref:Uncharacterized protein n=1 Tax=Prorocentrum cordatum TaxID=2364126 RepID=A0ABN9Y9J1_9DINO|nr:unnamed protein product [Polarella glacialis]